MTAALCGWTLIPSLSLHSLVLKPVNTVGGSREQCKLSQWGLGQIPSSTDDLSQKEQLWLQWFLRIFQKLSVIFCTKTTIIPSVLQYVLCSAKIVHLLLIFYYRYADDLFLDSLDETYNTCLTDNTNSGSLPNNVHIVWENIVGHFHPCIFNIARPSTPKALAIPSPLLIFMVYVSVL